MIVRSTSYFRRLLQKRPEVCLEYVLRVLSAPQRALQQADGRMRYWGFIVEQAKWLRVITLPDGTLHNAFFDRRFKP